MEAEVTQSLPAASGPAAPKLASPSPRQVLHDWLSWLDLLLHAEILRMQAAYQLSLDEFRGLYISDEQVARLVEDLAAQQASGEEHAPVLDELQGQAGALRQEIRERLPPDYPWRLIEQEFDLDPEEAGLLVLALAPDLDLKYETLYAYLNNDVTRKWPTFDLALRVLRSNERLRRLLLPEGKLFRVGLLQVLPPSPDRPGWLSTGFRAAPALVQAVLGIPTLDPILLGCTRRLETPVQGDGKSYLPFSDWIVDRLKRLAWMLARPGVTEGRPGSRSDPRPVFILTGRGGAGRQLAARWACAQAGRNLLVVEAGQATSQSPGASLAQALALQARLEGAAVYLEGGERLFGAEGRPLPEGQQLLRSLSESQAPLFLALPPGFALRQLLGAEQEFLELPLEDPDFALRQCMWRQEAQALGISLSPEAEDALAARFPLTAGEIRQVLRAGSRQRWLSQPSDAPENWEEVVNRVSLEDLLEAARSLSEQGVGGLAVKVRLVHSWDNLVLPPGTLRQVREVAAAIRNQEKVYAQWGFAQRLPAARGLKALFSGPSGTGKTMTASVIARDLGLDLFKIDLSSVVSKYIGETEKNLERIFDTARTSSAILFFDEADALFGKRSEVKDAHDRYANIEVAYLLQRLEEHEGAVILASNLSKNIDLAFQRRMHYVVEFPLPDEQHRKRLWLGMFPSQAPLGTDIDFSFLAAQFQLTGGDIRNVALDAAFLAAQDGQVIYMEHVVRALGRQMAKQGKIPSPTDFKQYYDWLGEPDG